ncbi:MAG: ribonuclease Z [Bacteroidota bacterium]
MIVVPLGIASATPTAVRHLPSVALWREGSVFLFDCGENTQMRMLQAGIKRSKVEYIFISHFDVDHFSGLIGLLSTLQLQRREKELTLVGPKGIKEYIDWNVNFIGMELSFELIYVEIEDGTDEMVVVDNEDYFVEARALKHRRYCLGYRFQEKDKPGKVDADKAANLGITNDEQFKSLKAGEDVTLEDGTVIKSYEVVGHPRPGDSFAYITDTEYCPNAVKLAMNTNILYHEATFGNNLADKAKETGHSTAADAARVATEAQAKLLVIGHFSARYTNPHVLLKEAREGFFPAWLANELRPIFTDPVHERGIITPKVELRELSERAPSPRGGDRGGGRGDFKPRGGGGDRNFRKRKSFGDRGDRGDRGGSRSGGGGYGNSRYDRSSRPGGGGYNRGGGSYSNDRNDRNDRSYGGGNRYGNDRNDNRGGGYNRSHNDRDRDYRSRDRDRDRDPEKQPRNYTPRTASDDYDRF